MLSLALRLEGELDEYGDNPDTERQIENLPRGAAEHCLPRAPAELDGYRAAHRPLRAAGTPVRIAAVTTFAGSREGAISAIG